MSTTQMSQNEIRIGAAIDGLLSVLEDIDEAIIAAMEELGAAKANLDAHDDDRRSVRMALALLGHDFGIPCEWTPDHPSCLCPNSDTSATCYAPMPLPETGTVNEDRLRDLEGEYPRDGTGPDGVRMAHDSGEPCTCIDCGKGDAADAKVR